MMVNVQPMKIPGRWRDGYALDHHTVSSTYLGDDEFGHAQFETKRSEVGELLYRLKYKSDASAVASIVETVAAFVAKGSVPCRRMNGTRSGIRDYVNWSTLTNGKGFGLLDL